MPRGPIAQLLKGVRRPQQQRLLVAIRNQLQTDRHPRLRKAARQRNRRQTRNVGRNRVDVVEVHLIRVGDLPLPERHRGRRRRDDQIRPLEHRVELPPNQRPYLLRLQVVGVVVAGRERVRAQQDAPLHFAPETVLSRRLHVLPHALPAPRRVAVLHPVVARQIGRALRRRKHVVDRQRVADRRQRRAAIQRRARAAQQVDRVFHRRRHAVVHPLPVGAALEELARRGDPQTVQPHAQLRAEIGRGLAAAGRVQRIRPGDRL